MKRPALPRLAAARARPQRGAALLTAMVIVTLVTTLAGAMLWQQWRAVQVEAAERARSQAHWILTGAIDWARLILREDIRTGPVDHLGEPWAVPLAEAKLSTFLALDRENTDNAPDAFLSGGITDAQSRYNLRNVIGPFADATAAAAEVKVLQRLLEFAGASGSLAPTLAQALRQASPSTGTTKSGTSNTGSTSGSTATSSTASSDAPLLPERLSQLAWLGIDANTIALIAPYVTILPGPTPVNANTAPKEVLAAIIDGLDLSSAERLVQARQRNQFKNLEAIKAQLPESLAALVVESRVAVGSRFFEITGRLRLEDRIVEERALVERRGQDIVSLRRERVASVEGSSS